MDVKAPKRTSLQQWNVAFVSSKARRNRELWALNPESHFHIRRGLKYRWFQYRSPHSIFRQTLSAPPLRAPLFFFSHLWPSTSTLPVLFLFPNFISLLSLYLSDLACTTTLRQAPYIRIGGGGERHFQIPSASISQDSWGGLIQSLPAAEVDSDI